MQTTYRADIDGLRAVAVLAVILYHAEFAVGAHTLLSGGFLGVDVFLVISGFLITSIILEEYRCVGRFSLGHFYERRARRLLPALLTVMLASIPFAWHYLLPTRLIDYAKSLLASLAFHSNFYWYDSLQEYGAQSSLLKPLLHTWSLAVEVQYYIFFPLLFLCLYRWMRQWVFPTIALILLLSFFLAQWTTLKDPSLSFYLFPYRFWELLAGGLLADILHRSRHRQVSPVLCNLLSVVGFLSILCAFLFFGLNNYHPGLFTLLPVAGTMLVIGFSQQTAVVTRMLSSRLFVGIGLISYSLYLWHYPIFAFGRIHSPVPSIPEKWGWMLLTLVLSIGSYFLIEKPFRREKTVPRRWFLRLCAAAAILITVFSAYVMAHDGVKQRFSVLMQVYGQNEMDNEILKSQSLAMINDERIGFSSEDGKKKHLLVVGNSHSGDLFNALFLNRELFPHYAFDRYYTQIGVSAEQMQEMLSSEKFKQADIVVISTRYIDKERMKQGLPYADDLKSLPQFIATLNKSGKKILVASHTVEFEGVSDIPIFDWYITQNMEKQTFDLQELKVLFFSRRLEDKISKINKRIQGIARDQHVPYLEKSDFICNTKARTCDGVTPDGYKSFYDYGHWTLEGAKHFGKRIHEINWLRLE